VTSNADVYSYFVHFGYVHILIRGSAFIHISPHIWLRW